MLTRNKQVCSQRGTPSNHHNRQWELLTTATHYICMETLKHLSQMEICRRMSILCQWSANETPPGPEQDRLQFASRKFWIEADNLAIQDGKALWSGL
jgi:hypothetical protein